MRGSTADCSSILLRLQQVLQVSHMAAVVGGYGFFFYKKSLSRQAAVRACRAGTLLLPIDAVLSARESVLARAALVDAESDQGLEVRRRESNGLFHYITHASRCRPLSPKRRPPVHEVNLWHKRPWCTQNRNKASVALHPLLVDCSIPHHRRRPENNTIPEKGQVL